MTTRGSQATVAVLTAWLALTLMPMSPLAAAGAPEYAGAYGGELVWTGSVTMTDDVLILAGGSLTIRAGTQVNVIPAEGTKIDPEYLSAQTELLVRGRLDIQGTPAAPVRFVVVDRPDGEAIAWAGITLDQAAPSAIRNAELARADIAIRCVGTSPEIHGNRIVDCRYGIVAQQQSHPRITGNQLADGEGGIFCWRGSNPVLSDNRITGHDEEAVFVDGDSRPRLEVNAISGNAVGLALYPRELPFEGAAITGNTENVRWLGRQGQGGP